MMQGRRSSTRLQKRQQGNKENQTRLDVNRASAVSNVEQGNADCSISMTVTSASRNSTAIKNRKQRIVASDSSAWHIADKHERNLSMMDERMFQYPLTSTDEQAITAHERQTSIVNSAGAKINFVSPHAEDESTIPKSASSTSTDSLPLVVGTTNVGNATAVITTAVTHRKSKRATLSCMDSYTSSVYFPVLVHRMVSHINRVNTALIHWCNDGTHFWISDRHAALSEALTIYFKHKNYNSLRRQLHAYQFTKETNGPKRGYWCRPTFSKDSSFETLKRCKPGRRPTGIVKRKATFHGPDQRKRAVEREKAASSPDVDLGSVASATSDDFSVALSTAAVSKANDTHPDKSESDVEPNGGLSRGNTKINDPCTPQCEAFRSSKSKEYSIEPDESVALSQMEFSVDGINSTDEADEPVLNMLAITASHFRRIPSKSSLHRVPTFSPISITEHQNKGVSMILLADAANLFEPTPIKPVYPDLCRVFDNSPLPSLCDGDTACGRFSIGTAIGSFGTPLRTSVKSAFTPISSANKSVFAPLPVVDLERRTSPEFYEPFIGLTGTLFAAVGVSNSDIDGSSSASISSLGDNSGSSPPSFTSGTDLKPFSCVVGSFDFAGQPMAAP